VIESYGRFVTLPLNYPLKSQIQSASFGSTLSPVWSKSSLTIPFARQSSSFSHASSPEKKFGSLTPAFVRNTKGRCGRHPQAELKEICPLRGQ